MRMDRRTLILSGLALIGGGTSACAQTNNAASDRYSGAPAPALSPAPQAGGGPNPTGAPAEPYEPNEIVTNISDFFGVTAEQAGGVVERTFKENGRPTAYIAGEEASAAITVGARYGRGMLYMKGREPMEVFWQGPSLGFDLGGNASRVFTLCYNLQFPDAIFQRFPGVEGSAYFIGGLGVNYQRASDITLAPVRAGVGLRLGANIGYLAYTRKRNILPF
jgi:hypothetical protein